MHPRVAVVFLLAPLASACARPAAPAVAPDHPSKTVAVYATDPIVVRAHSSMELLAELERARGLLLLEKNDQAAEALDRLFDQADDPAIKAIAAYHAGLAYEGLGNRAVALERYRTVADTFADQGVARNALVRMTRILGHLERWEELARAADQLLARGELPVMDEIEARGAKALAAVERGDLDGAGLQVGKAAELIDRNGFGQSGLPPVQVAQVSFAEGEIRRLKSEAIKLVPVTPSFAQTLEARCQGLLDAQSAFTDAMRARDAHWSAMSGFRVGELYSRLHSEAMSIPPPESASLKDKQLFEGALRLRYRILLEKGLKMMDATVRLGDRTGEDSEWVSRAREAKKTIEQDLADEKAALAKLPYSEAELRAALDTVKNRPKPPAGKSPR